MEIIALLRRMLNRIWYGSSGKHCCYIDSAYLAHLCQHGKPAASLVQSNQSSLVLSHVTLSSGTVPIGFMYVISTYIYHKF